MAEKVSPRRARLLVVLAVMMLLLALWPQPVVWAYVNLGSIETNKYLVGRERAVSVRNAEENLTLAALLGVVRAYRQLARIQYQRGDYPAAQQSLEHWLVQHPDDQLGHWEMGRIYEAQGNRGAAIHEWRLAEAFHFLMRLGNDETERGRWGEAVGLYEAAIEVSAARAASPIAQRWDYVAERGWEAHQHLGRALWQGIGDVDGAIRQYEWAATLAPWNINLYIEVAAQFEASGKWNDARRWYERALEVDPGNSELLGYLARNRLLAGDAKEAARWARENLAVNPQRSDAWVVLYRALMDQKLYAEAVTEMRRALAGGVRTATIQYCLGSALLADQQYADAEEAFRQSLALQPGDPNTEWGLGLVYRDTGRWPEAIQQLRDALDRRPDAVAIRADLAYAYLMAGRTDEARSEYEKVMEQSPENEAARRQLEALGE